ncbi:S-adenosyl-L-methionine-dependent methyltransferase [Cercophora newfieldiana]|uniref:S-adenosyl-L-methionine-dependent methyltransferase n=1 Tax=Cercophora newfieldiana TaxID=92897 RepID=A0AA39YMK5_9PEZI|nr:S-adenosyl-L-methionine-dependent methyltransferase [Cercophora newfieldiana]
MASEQNKAFFNQEAASYDSKHEKTLAQIVKEIQSRLDFIGVDWVDDDEGSDDDNVNEGGSKKQVRLLDYASGTGVISRALASHTTQCVGIDLSDNMVATYNTRAENQGLSESEMRAYQGNLTAPDDPSPAAFSSPNFFNFDIAAVGLGFHHFDNPALAAQRLVERLRPGGVLFVLDFLPHEKMHSSHAASHTVTHHGFSREAIQKIFEDAGAGKDFALQDVAVVFNRATETGHEMRRQLFLARGTKA